MNDSKITKAFRELRKLGYFARQNFWCCQSCAWAAIPKSRAGRTVFYHQQDAQHLRSRGECHLAWAGDGTAIVEVLKRHDLQVEWEGSKDERILIKL